MAETARLMGEIYRAGGYDFAVDEVYTLGRNNFASYPSQYIDLLTRGRSRGISVWTCSQRPRFVPLFAFTESRHIFVFALGSADDRKHIAKMAGVDGLDRPLVGHDFIYFNRETRQIIQARLGRDELK
jgi:hypothetical protein